MNIPQDKAEHHCQALAEIHELGNNWLAGDEDAQDDTIGTVVALWENTISIIYDTYFAAIEATDEERAELGL